MKPKELREYFRGLSYDYQRFRDAIKDGKRVFNITNDGSATEGTDFAFTCHPKNYAVEGIDIPMQPTQEWLDERDVELTGECKSPIRGEWWVSIKSEGAKPFEVVKGHPGAKVPESYGDRRWIVRPKAKKEPELERCEIVACGNILTCGGGVNISEASSCANFAGYEYEDGTVWLTPWRIVVSPFVGEKDKMERAKYVLFRRNT